MARGNTKSSKMRKPINRVQVGSEEIWDDLRAILEFVIAYDLRLTCPGGPEDRRGKKIIADLHSAGRRVIQRQLSGWIRYSEAWTVNYITKLYRQFVKGEITVDAMRSDIEKNCEGFNIARNPKDWEWFYLITKKEIAARNGPKEAAKEKVAEYVGKSASAMTKRFQKAEIGPFGFGVPPTAVLANLHFMTAKKLLRPRNRTKVEKTSKIMDKLFIRSVGTPRYMVQLREAGLL